MVPASVVTLSWAMAAEPTKTKEKNHRESRRFSIMGDLSKSIYEI
jgi:hypothetical protein